MTDTYSKYARDMDWITRNSQPPKSTKCKECGSKKDLIPINTVGDYVCGECWDAYGYEYDPTPP